MASVTTKIAVEGASKFKADFREAGLAVKATSSELKFLSNELGRTGASEDALANKSSALKSAIEAESNAIKLLQDRLSVLADNGAENSAEAQKWTAELYKHKDAMGALQSELDETNEAMKSFGSGSDEAKTEVDELGDQAEQTGEQIGSDFAKEVAVANTVVSKLADLAVDAVKGIVNIGKSAVAYDAEMESYSKTISAFFRTSGQSASTASANTEKLIENQKKLSAQIGIGTSVLIDANKMLIASGVSGNDAQIAVEGLAKAIVATGGGQEELSRMAQNLQQISNTGKASTQDLKQFASAGIDVFGLLADSTGYTVEQLHDMDITYDMIVQALQLATSEGGKFFESATSGTETLQGKTNLLKSTWEESIGTAFQPVADVLANEIVPMAIEFVEGIDWEGLSGYLADLAYEFKDILDAVKWFYDNFAGYMQGVRDRQQEMWEDVNNKSDEGAKIFGDSLDDMTTHFELSDERLESAFTGMGTSTEDAVSVMAKALGKLPPEALKLESGFFNPVTFSMQTLADNAYKYGNDYTINYARGITDGMPSLNEAVSGVTDAIYEPLHFSRPDKGVLRDYEQWMPDFVSGLARTMRESEWMLADASQDLAQTITNNTVTNNINMTINGSQGQNVSDLADVVMLRIQQATDRRSAVWA